MFFTANTSITASQVFPKDAAMGMEERGTGGAGGLDLTQPLMSNKPVARDISLIGPAPNCRVTGEDRVSL
jgi:hypothetical protein